MLSSISSLAQLLEAGTAKAFGQPSDTSGLGQLTDACTSYWMKLESRGAMSAWLRSSRQHKVTGSPSLHHMNVFHAYYHALFRMHLLPFCGKEHLVKRGVMYAMSHSADIKL